jgi:hypothetical protein
VPESGILLRALRHIAAFCAGSPYYCLFFNFGPVIAMQYGPQRRGIEDKGDLMDPKLAILFLLIGCVIGLSHLNEENLGRMRRQFVSLRWREFVPLRRRS